MLLRIEDDRLRELTFPGAPRRVVSLVPSDTYTIAAIGCGDALVGRTDYCELPKDVVAKVPSVGGTKNPDVKAILDLAPDLVVANQEENTKGDLEKLAQAGVRVYIAFPKTVSRGIVHIARLARIFRIERDAVVRDLVKRSYTALREAEEARAKVVPLRVFCPIWMDPLMTVHGDTFISDMLDLAGAQNVFADRERRYPLAADLGKARALAPEKVAGRDTRYPRVTMEEVTARAPEIVVLPDEPHPFTEEDAEVFRRLPIPAAEDGGRRVVRTPGKDLCWYGAQSADGIARVRALVDGLR